MGPVVSAKQRKRVLGYCERGADEARADRQAAARVPGKAATTSSPPSWRPRQRLRARGDFGPVAYLAIRPRGGGDRAGQLAATAWPTASGPPTSRAARASPSSARRQHLDQRPQRLPPRRALRRLQQRPRRRRPLASKPCSTTRAASAACAAVAATHHQLRPPHRPPPPFRKPRRLRFSQTSALPRTRQRPRSIRACTTTLNSRPSPATSHSS